MRLGKELESIKPQGATSAVVWIKGANFLFDSERHCMRNAIQKRRDEFAAGRAAARTAIRSLGLPPMPILRANDRRPVWPKGIVGSISHSEGAAAALVARESDWAGLGLDIEGSGPLKVELRRHILTVAEISDCDDKPTVCGAPRCKVSFAAKEALFKAVYPLTRRFFGFRDARILFQGERYWNAEFLNPKHAMPQNGVICQGRWAAVGETIIATVGVKSGTVHPKSS